MKYVSAKTTFRFHPASRTASAETDIKSLLNESRVFTRSSRSSRLINVIPPVNYKHPHEWLVQYLIVKERP